MTRTYATVTAKGQITIPAKARRALDLQPGQRLAVHVQGDTLMLSAPTDIDKLRDTIRKEATAKGTWGTVPVANDGWNARAQEYVSQSPGQHNGER